MTELDARAWGVAVGCSWGGSVAITGLVARFCNVNPQAIRIIQKVYLGYSNTIPGSLIGGVWGFIDGAITGTLLAWCYNRFVV